MTWPRRSHRRCFGELTVYTKSGPRSIHLLAGILTVDVFVKQRTVEFDFVV